MKYVKTWLFGTLAFFHAGGQTTTDTNHRLWYERPAAKWLEALPLGNGTLGGMVYGSTTAERIRLNEGSLVTGTPNYVGFYQALGDLFIETGHEQTSGYQRSLDLSEAIHRVKYRHAGVDHVRESFVSQPDQAMVVMLTSATKGRTSVKIRLEDDRKSPLTVTGNRIFFRGALKENGMEYACGLQVVHRGGKLVSNPAGIEVVQADTVMIVLNAVTSFKRFSGRDVFGKLPMEQLESGLQQAARQTYASLKRRHRDDFTRLFGRVDLVLGAPVDKPTYDRVLAVAGGAKDPALDALMFQYGRYLLISSSRKGGLPANLQGIWNDSSRPPWYSQYTTKINIEMNYWLAEVTNLSEIHQPLFDWVLNMSKVQKTTQDSVIRTSRGWVSYSTNNIMGGGSGWRIHRPGSAWLSSHFWEHFLFTRDTMFLREKAFPLIRDIVDFWEHHLVARPDGKLITPDGWSPEHGPGKNEGDQKPYPGATYDQQIVFDLFNNYVRASEILGMDAAHRRKISVMRDRLLGPVIGRWGQIQEWQDDVDDSTDRHRHLSHLFAVYPGSQITPWRTPDWARAAAVSLQSRGDRSTGWSSAWRISLWARLWDAEKAYQSVKTLVTPAERAPGKPDGSGVYTNLFGAHPPFQMDANFGFTAGVAEMLLQSHSDTIHFLPALPNAWPDGQVKGLKARGNITVDMQWKEGRLHRAILRPAFSGYYRFRYQDRVVRLMLLKGQTYVMDDRLTILREGQSPIKIYPKPATDLSWWKRDKFGMFIHWGLSTLMGQEISWSRGGYGAQRYDSLKYRFNPVAFNADQWVAVAKSGGMKYIIFTAKHHDGFCNWFTKTTDHHIGNTPFRRDICKELADAARKAGLKIGWYYSPADWKDEDCRDPERNVIYQARMKEQVRELLTRYGKIDLMWFDFEGGPIPGDPSVLYRMAKQLQPGIIINNRLDVVHTDESHGYVGPNGDYATPEGFVAGWGGVPWETCTNLGHQWGWKWNDEPRRIGEVQQTLIRCVGGNGNLLLNVGPDSLGRIPENFAARFRELGEWIRPRSASIYGTSPGVLTPGREYVSVMNAGVTYIHFWGKKRDAIILPPVKGRIRSVMSHDGKALSYVSSDTALIIRPDASQIGDEIITCALNIEGVDRMSVAVPPPSTSGSVAYRAKVTASSSVAQMLHDPLAAVDDNPGTHWKPGRRTDVDWHAYYGMNVNYRNPEVSSLFQDTAWLEVDLGRDVSVGSIRLMEYKFFNSTIGSFEVQAMSGGIWKSVATGTKMGEWAQKIDPVVARKFRLVIRDAKGMPGIREFQLFSN